jgi:pimeloyl-ACP methyl ester carboxylesterase
MTARHMSSHASKTHSFGSDHLVIGSVTSSGPRVLLLASLVLVLAVGPARGNGDFAGLVAIGDGRKMFLECRGAGAPTVVLISGKGNGAADWNEILDPSDPIHTAPTDLLAVGQGKLVANDKAVLPSVSSFTRVCAYDRPGVRLDGKDISTPVPQPHEVDHAVDDLHKLLMASGESAPYVLVAHSYGGIVAMLFTRKHADEVAGLVMVDTVTELMTNVASARAVTAWDASNKISNPEAPEAVQLLDAFAKIEAAPPRRELPAIVLSADKPWPDIAGVHNAATEGAMVTFTDWLTSEDMLAKSLDAPRIAQTNSGHNIYQYSPQLVVDAIRMVVDAVRQGSRHLPH